jgi:hypothetical protein
MQQVKFQGILFFDLFILLWITLIIYSIYIYLSNNKKIILNEYQQDEVNIFVQKIIYILEDDTTNHKQKIHKIEEELDYLNEETQNKIMNYN